MIPLSQQPLVAIVIVNYNGQEDTLECLESLSKTTYENKRIIVVDNGSQEPPSEIKRRFPEVQLIELKENTGFAGGNNTALRRLPKNTAYALLLNNDTVVKEDFLEPLVKTAESEQSIGLVCPKIYYHAKPNTLWFAGSEMRGIRGVAHLGDGEVDRGQYDSQEDVGFLTGCALLIKKSVLESVGFLDDDFFLYYEDVDYCLRASAAGYRLVYQPASVIWHKVKQSTSKKSGLVQFFIEKNVCLLAYKNGFNPLLFSAYQAVHMLKTTFGGLASLDLDVLLSMPEGKLWFLKYCLHNSFGWGEKPSPKYEDNRLFKVVRG